MPEPGVKLGRLEVQADAPPPIAPEGHGREEDPRAVPSQHAPELPGALTDADIAELGEADHACARATDADRAPVSFSLVAQPEGGPRGGLLLEAGEARRCP